MIYVEVNALKSEGRGEATGNGWHDTDDVAEAVSRELDRFHRTWDRIGHGAIVTYTITVAPEASPRRTKTDNAWPPPREPHPADVSARSISDECKRCGGEMSHDGSALDLLGYCQDCGEQTQREYLG